MIPRRWVPLAVLAAPALACGWLVGYALDEPIAAAPPRTPWSAPRIVAEALPATPQPPKQARPAADTPAGGVTTTPPPTPRAAAQPASAARTATAPPTARPRTQEPPVTSQPPKPSPSSRPAPEPAPAPQPEPQPEPDRPRWTAADQAAAEAKCAALFGPGSTPVNTPEIGDEHNPELQYPCLRPAHADPDGLPG